LPVGDGLPKAATTIFDTQQSNEESIMNVGGLIVMVLSVGSVLTLVGFCLFRVLNLPPIDVGEHLKGPLDIDTQDTLDMD
jgi:hypothetical protein